MPHVPIDHGDRGRMSPSPVWAGKTAVTVALSSFHGELRAEARKAGFQNVCVLLDADPQAPENKRELGRISGKLRDFGWLITGWAPAYTPDQAGRAAYLVSDLGLDGWCANLEAWAEGDNRGVTEDWLSEFRKRQPRTPLAVTCLSSTTDRYARDFDYRACLQARACIAPQVYGSNQASLTVLAMEGTMERGQVPRSMLTPWFSFDQGPVPYSDYEKWDGPYGVWTAESVTVGEYKAMGSW